MSDIIEIYRNTFDSIAGIYKITSTYSSTLYFSISEDTKIFSEWQEVNHSNLMKFAYPKNRKVTLRIGVLEESEQSETSEQSEQPSEIDLEIETVSMKGASTNNCTSTKISTTGCYPDTSITISNEDLGIAESNTYNPYSAVDAAAAISEAINSAVNDSYGLTVKYFKTSPDKRTEDYILNEYSLRNVISSSCVKIMLPSNGIPSADIQFNPLMMDYPTLLTIHILKSHFRSIFGNNAHPDTGDYIYVSNQFHNMYEINSVIDDTRFEKVSAYWVVTLKQFEKRAERIYSEDSKGEQLFKDTELVISGTGEFYEKDLSDKAYDSMEKASHTIQEQISNTDGNGYDYLRKTISDKIIITNDILKNRAKVISENQYNMSNVQGDAVIYNNTYDLSSKENEMTISFIFYVNDTNDCTLLKASKDTNISIDISNQYLTFNINNSQYKYQKICTDTLYGVILMYNNKISNMVLYVFNPISKLNYTLSQDSCISKNIKSFTLKDAVISLTGFNGMITNIKILNKTISEENQQILLTQTVIKDSQLLMLTDTAREHLTLDTIY